MLAAWQYETRGSWVHLPFATHAAGTAKVYTKWACAAITAAEAHSCIAGNGDTSLAQRAPDTAQGARLAIKPAS